MSSGSGASAWLRTVASISRYTSGKSTGILILLSLMGTSYKLVAFLSCGMRVRCRHRGHSSLICSQLFQQEKQQVCPHFATYPLLMGSLQTGQPGLADVIPPATRGIESENGLEAGSGSIGQGRFRDSSDSLFLLSHCLMVVS